MAFSPRPKRPGHKSDYMKSDEIQLAKKMFDIVLLAAAAGDDERAHAAEKDLWEYVLYHVHKEHLDSKALATIAYNTRAISFSRWYS